MQPICFPEFYPNWLCNISTWILISSSKTVCLKLAKVISSVSVRQSKVLEDTTDSGQSRFSSHLYTHWISSSIGSALKICPNSSHDPSPPRLPFLIQATFQGVSLPPLNSLSVYFQYSSQSDTICILDTDQFIPLLKPSKSKS